MTSKDFVSGTALAPKSVMISKFSLIFLLVLASFTAQAGVVQITEYFHSGMNRYFLTSHQDEKTKLDTGYFTGWTRTGYSFFAFDAADSGLMGVCRYYGDLKNGSPTTHVYSANPQECEKLSNDPTVWTFEETAFYIALPVGQACPTGTETVNRLYNNSKNGGPNHRYVTDGMQAFIMQQQGWTFEGGVFCAPLVSGAGGGGTNPPPVTPPPVTPPPVAPPVTPPTSGSCGSAPTREFNVAWGDYSR